MQHKCLIIGMIMKPITIIPTKIPIKTLKSQGNIFILVYFCWYNVVRGTLTNPRLTDNLFMDSVPILNCGRLSELVRLPV